MLFQVISGYIKLGQVSPGSSCYVR